MHRSPHRRPSQRAYRAPASSGTALLFWRAVLIAWSGRRLGPAVGATFATLMHGGLLGALITMAPRPLYAWYRGRTEVWSLNALEDQQLAGLLMWVPMGIIYMAASLLARESPRGRRECPAVKENADE